MDQAIAKLPRLNMAEPGIQPKTLEQFLTCMSLILSWSAVLLGVLIYLFRTHSLRSNELFSTKLQMDCTCLANEAQLPSVLS